MIFCTYTYVYDNEIMLFSANNINNRNYDPPRVDVGEGVSEWW